MGKDGEMDVARELLQNGYNSVREEVKKVLRTQTLCVIYFNILGIYLACKARFTFDTLAY